MCHSLYKISRWIAVIMFAAISSLMVKQNEWVRIVLEGVLLTEFLAVSVLYEKRRKWITVGYMYMYIIMFIVYCICPFYYNGAQLEREKKRYIGVPQDYFSLYFLVVSIALLCVILYLIVISKYSFYIKKSSTDGISRKDDYLSVILIGIFVSLPLSLAKNATAICYVPIICYFWIDFLRKRKITIYHIVSLMGFLLILKEYGFYRYIMVQYLLPVLIITVILLGDRKISVLKIISIVGLTAAFLILYGISSEIIKLNHFLDKGYNVIGILSSPSGFWEFLYRQVYRVFGIWTRLGGNIIEHTIRNDFYYGLTYIKPLASLLDFPYVSLPIISASYVQASYAQPGLVAEGYANFGIIGSIINLLIPFFLSEFFVQRLKSHNSSAAICFAVIPFTKVLIDGGSVNSIIFGILICFLAFSGKLFLMKRKVRLVGKV